MSDVTAPTGAPVQQSQSTQNQQQAPQSQSSGAQSTQVNAKKATDEVLKSIGQETDVDLEDDGSDLEDSPEQKQQKRQEAAAKKYKLKVSGKDVEVDEAELLKRAQMGFSADEKWQEAAKMRKQLENFVNYMQKDPEGALTKMGFNVEELAAGVIEKRIEQMKKSPEQLELENLRREREEMVSEREREKADLQTREMKRMQDEYAVTIENDINQALDAPDFGLPKSPYFVKRIADVMIWGINSGKEITAAQASKIVRDEVKKEWSEMYNSMDDDDRFEQMIGKSRLDKYRRSKIKRTKKAPSASDIRQTGATELRSLESEKPKEKVHMKQFFRNLGNK